MRVRIVMVAVASAVAAATLVGGCGGGEDEQKDAGPKATVLVPGKPGEPNKTEVRGPAPAKPPSAEELRFVQMMIPHHRQAVEMGRLAPGRVRSAQVKSLADRIVVGQQGEIAAMESWLKNRGKSASASPSGHGHAAPSSTAHANMPGMATPQQLQQLRAAKGADFDRLFLTLMITHHQGALTMAKDTLGRGEDVIVQELIRDVQSTQQAEINRMRVLLNGE